MGERDVKVSEVITITPKDNGNLLTVEEDKKMKKI